MLKSLDIQDLALIARAHIDFEAGFTAVTGESGAGKSVFLGAVRLAAGGKANGQAVRAGAEKAVVEAVFDVSALAGVKEFLARLEIDAEGGELVVQREVLATGKHRARLNGVLVPQGELQGLGELLVQMHGQSEQLLLKNTGAQGELLDNFCGNASLLQEYRELWGSYSSLLAQIRKTQENAGALAQQKEFLEFQAKELSKASLRDGEEAELQALVAEASGSEARRSLVEESLSILESEGGAIEQARHLISKLRFAHSKFPDLPGEEQVALSLDALQDLSRALRGALKGASHSPQEIDRANARIAAIQKLKRKYRTDEAGLVALAAQRARELESLENLDSDLAELEKQLAQKKAALSGVAAKLSARRAEGAKKLDGEVQAVLHTLGMAGATFETRLTGAELGALGAEKAEFFMAPNKGEGVRPLRLAASGGELSRVLLAFKTVLAGLDQTPVLVFDEVDSGISGETANSIGSALHGLGKYHQVLTITHLHQVASAADAQVQVRKFESEGRTFTEVRACAGEDRVGEIARMLGDARSPTVLAHARELLIPSPSDCSSLQ
jgi:DNA repair protein RecN (Recombination protein N)